MIFFIYQLIIILLFYPKIKKNFKKHLHFKSFYAILIFVEAINVAFEKWRHRQVVKTPPFHGGFVGSNPAGVTIIF